jgi:beta-phosphoglucomutase-like phosphatase (HAD superfamily)
MKLKLPEGNFRAYLFDCDGTIADSMPLHYNAWKAVLADWSCDYPEEVFYSWGGKPVRKIIADLNKMNGLKMPVEALAMRKEGLYLAQLPQLKAIPEVLEHIEAEHGRIPFAVVSGSTRDSVVGSRQPIAWSLKTQRWALRRRRRRAWPLSKFPRRWNDAWQISRAARRCDRR